MRAVGVEANQFGQGHELPPSDEVIPAVGVDLKVVNVARTTEERNGIVARLGLTLPDKIHSLFSLKIL